MSWAKRFSFSILGNLILGAFALPPFFQPFTLVHLAILGIGVIIAIPLCINVKYHLDRLYGLTSQPFSRSREINIAIFIIIAIAIAFQFLERDIINLILVSTFVGFFLLTIYGTIYHWRHRPRKQDI
jgi:hypothetical protein